MPTNNNDYYYQERFPNGQEKKKEDTLGIQAQGVFQAVGCKVVVINR
jgi:hypothetical protein